jgi:hypothetical protein
MRAGAGLGRVEVRDAGGGGRPAATAVTRTTASGAPPA